MTTFYKKARVDESGHRTNSLAFAKVDCHTCSALKQPCDRKRPHCGTCISQHRTCGGFAMDLVWKDLAVASDPVASPQSYTSGRRQRQGASSKQRPDFKFVQGRPRRKRKPKEPQQEEIQPRYDVGASYPNTTHHPFPATPNFSRPHDSKHPHSHVSPTSISSSQSGEYTDVSSDSSVGFNDLNHASPYPNLDEPWSEFPNTGHLSGEFGMILPPINLPRPIEGSTMRYIPQSETQNDHETDIDMPAPSLIYGVFYRNIAHKYGQVFRMYDEDFCVLPVTNDCIQNPFRVPAERCESSEFLLHAVLALSSHHLARKNDCSALTLNMHNHWSTAIRLFSKTLGQSSPLPLLDAILLFICFDVGQSASSLWSVHLAGALRLLSQAGFSEYYQGCSRVRAQIAMLVWWDVSVALLSRREPIFPLAYLEMLMNYSHGADGWSFFDLTGCPIELVIAMARLAKLAAIYEKTTQMEWTIFDRAPVDDIIQEVRDFINTEDVRFDELERLEEGSDARRNRYHCIEAWRHAILLYACRVFTRRQDVYQIRQINHLARVILDHVRSIPTTDLIQKQVLLPLFLAASEVGDKQSRLFARQYCRHWDKVSRFYHFESARVLLENIWRDWDPLTRDVYWWGVKVGMGNWLHSNNGEEDVVSEVLLG